jgi:C1A family cysteine protease
MQNQSLIVTDNGTSLESTAIGLQIFGVCEEYIWSYHSENINQQQPVYVYGQASKMTVVPLKLARNLIAMKTCLANEIPFIIAIRLMPQASDEVRDNNGYLLMPNLNDPQLKSSPMHAVVIVGYNDETETFIVRNSWGSKWVRIKFHYMVYVQF